MRGKAFSILTIAPAAASLISSAALAQESTSYDCVIYMPSQWQARQATGGWGNSKSAATIKAYASGWRDFLHFCAQREVNALPAS